MTKKTDRILRAVPAAILLAMLVTGVNIKPAHADFADGSGTEDDPYLVETPEHLDNIRNHLDEHFRQIADIDLKGYGDEEKGWEPIGGDDNAFNGTFDGDEGKGWKPVGAEEQEAFEGLYDGNGFLISHMTIKCSENNLGFFRRVGEEGKIINVGLNNAKVEGPMDGVRGRMAVGGIAGINNGAITNSYVVGEITGKNYIGGITGINRGALEKSYALGNIEGESDVGGLVGKNAGRRGSQGGVIENSYSGASVRGEEAAGGLAGSSGGKIHRCYSIGKVEYPNISHTSYRLVGRNRHDHFQHMIPFTILGEVTKSYYRINIDIPAEESRPAGTAKTSLEMRQKGTYKGWDFDGTWKIREGESYPFLSWQQENIPEMPGERYSLDIGIDGKGETRPKPGTYQCRVDSKTVVGVASASDWRFSHWLLDGESIEEKPFISIPPGSEGQTRTLVAVFEKLEPESDFAGGSGTREEPYLVSNPRQLDMIRYYPDKNFRLIENIDLGEAGGDHGWVPIGERDKPFTGLLDGGGHTIKNVVVERNRVPYAYGGLFAILGEEAEVRNVALADVSVKSMAYAGGLAGINEGKISKVSVSSRVTVKDSGRQGQRLFHHAVVDVGDCVGNFALAGSLIGENRGNVANSYGTGEVAGERFIGGLIGRNSGKVSNCYSSAEVSGSNFLGGLIGANEIATAVIQERSFSFRNVEKTEGKVVESYYDRDTTGQQDTDRGTPKFTNQMMQQETFEDWDFEEIWAIGEGESYPYLKWEDNNFPPGKEKETDNTVAKSPVQDGLQLKISLEPESPEFEESQAGGLSVVHTYTNKGDTPLVVFDFWTTLQMEGEHSYFVLSPGPKWPWGPRRCKTRVVEPGGRDTRWFENMTDFKEAGGEPGRRFTEYGKWVIEPGKHEITVLYQMPEDEPLPEWVSVPEEGRVWRGKLRTEPLTITVESE